MALIITIAIGIIALCVIGYHYGYDAGFSDGFEVGRTRTTFVIKEAKK
jgi:hypothetical protein